MLHIDTLILPGRVRQDVFVVNGRFCMDPVDGAVTVFAGGYAIPGLVDAHAHLALHSPAGASAPEEEQVRASARAQLEAGVLLVREPGSPTRVARDIVTGDGLPRVHTAGRFLAGRGRYFPGLAREVSPEELPAAVGEELAWSGHWAKVIGDFFDAEGRITPVFRTEVLKEAAATAHTAGGRITMHCMTPAAVEQAIEAGFDGVEHGTDITADLVKAMAQRAVTWVPTLTIADPVRQMVTNDPTTDTDRILRGLDAQPEMVRLGAEAGVRILAGTDAGMVPHGVVAAEIRLLAAAGLSPRDALAAGSWEARHYLGLPLIEDGAPADVVIYPDDPTEDLAVLSHPSLIMIGGKVIARH
jgi:imidazolonepropionase-like amidohydrolase